MHSTLSTTGPLGRQLGWGNGNGDLDVVSKPELRRRSAQLPSPQTEAKAEPHAPPPIPPEIQAEIEGAMAEALAAHPPCEELRCVARQVALVILDNAFGSRAAAAALSTLPEAIRSARLRIAPAIADKAMEVTPTAASFARIFAAAKVMAPRWHMRELVTIAADTFKVDRRELYTARRTRSIVRPRQTAMWLCKRFTPRSFPDIGKHFGGRDHTTVLHACRKMDDLIEAHGIEGGKSPAEWAWLLCELFEGRA